MTRPRFKTCFISAPFGTDTSLLREILDEKRIRWHDQTNVRAGENWIEAVDSAITRADFVCVVLPAQGYRENALFELGMAYARRKPVLAFLGPSVSLPSDVLGLTYVRLDPASPEVVRSALETFLAHASPTRPARVAGKPAKTAPVSRVLEQPPASLAGFAAEEHTVELFKQAGFIVSEISQGSAVDFAVWIDEVQHSLGNPLLVEVKTGSISDRRLSDATASLRQNVERTHGRCGLIVYWDRQSREFAEASPGWPLIFRLSGESLTQLLSRGQLAQRLVELRNRAAHGVS